MVQSRATHECGCVRVCPSCGSESLKEFGEGHGKVCTDCSFVINLDSLRELKELQKNRQNEKKEFTLKEQSIETSELSIINDGTEKAYGERIQDQKDRILEEWQRSSISDATEKNLTEALLEITKIACQLNLPTEVLEKASTIYKMAVEKCLIKGRVIKALCAGSIYIACKKCGHPRTIYDMVAASQINRRQINQNCKLLLRELKLSMPPTKPIEYVLEISKKHSLKKETIDFAINILNAVEDSKILIGKDPLGFAGAALFISSSFNGEKKTQRAISSLLGVTEVTIRNRLKDLKSVHISFLKAGLV